MNSHTIDPISDFISDRTLQRFAGLFNRFSNSLDSALARATAEYQQHMLSKGAVCEAAVRGYLSETLGGRYAVADGFIFDSTGAESKQQDVIIFDDHWSVRLTPKGSKEPIIVPVESVYATIEVKKSLSSADLHSAIENVLSFKSLKRESVGPQHVTPNKRIRNLGMPGQMDLRNPYFSAIFAFDAERSMEAILAQLKNEVTVADSQKWPDVVAVHNKGIILPFCATCQKSGAHISKIEMDGHEPTFYLDKIAGSFGLLGFHLLLMYHLHHTILGPVDFFNMYARLAHVTRFLAQQEKSTEE